MVLLFLYFVGKILCTSYLYRVLIYFWDVFDINCLRSKIISNDIFYFVRNQFIFLWSLFIIGFEIDIIIIFTYIMMSNHFWKLKKLRYNFLKLRFFTENLSFVIEKLRMIAETTGVDNYEDLSRKQLEKTFTKSSPSI